MYLLYAPIPYPLYHLIYPVESMRGEQAGNKLGTPQCWADCSALAPDLQSPRLCGPELRGQGPVIKPGSCHHFPRSKGFAKAHRPSMGRSRGLVAPAASTTASADSRMATMSALCPTCAFTTNVTPSSAIRSTRRCRVAQGRACCALSCSSLQGKGRCEEPLTNFEVHNARVSH